MREDHVDYDRFQAYILAPDRKIRKQIIYSIIENNPEQALKCQINQSNEGEKKPNQFLAFLQKHGKQYLQKCLKQLRNIDQYQLTQWGTYLAKCSNDDRYINISNFQVSYFQGPSIGSRIKHQQAYKGFIYRYDKSMYVGPIMQQLKASGDGYFLYKELKKKKQSLQIQEIFHIYDGRWKNGEISNGSRKSYEDYYGEPFIEYQGGFKNFQFQGPGTRRIKGRQPYSGIFIAGKKKQEQRKSNVEEIFAAAKKKQEQDNMNRTDSNQRLQKKSPRSETNRLIQKFTTRQNEQQLLDQSRKIKKQQSDQRE